MATVKKVMHNWQWYNPNRTIHNNWNNYNAVKIINNWSEYTFWSSEANNNLLSVNGVKDKAKIDTENIIDNEVDNDIVSPETIDDDWISTVS